MADSKLSGDKVNEERAFIKRYTEGISGRDVAYQGDFSTPLEDRPRKVAVIGVSAGVSFVCARYSCLAGRPWLQVLCRGVIRTNAWASAVD